MSKIKENISLKAFNTFGIEVFAQYFTEAVSTDDFRSIIFDNKFKTIPKLILGGGSNVLFTKNVEGIVVRNNLKGIDKIDETQDHVFIKSAAGEVWHQFVMYCIENNYGGVENLSLIPGSVGAGPMQNIGAYGVEVKETFFELEAIHIETGDKRIFNSEDCRFGYRQSVFKAELKNQYIITSVTFRLDKVPHFNISYGAIKSELEKMNITELNIRNISSAVINIRRSKLPDPVVIGNAGSFFKNPEVAKEKYEHLKSVFEGCVGYVLENGNVKLAAGWLIEQCGWKGKVVGNTGSHKDQALVLVNYGGATGAEIFKLAKDIQQSVKEKFDVNLEMEVNII
ncbi:MAG: UDP-N-acetylmuramate dehydrogenase [Bacteroidia bacterium]